MTPASFNVGSASFVGPKGQSLMNKWTCWFASMRTHTHSSFCSTTPGVSTHSLAKVTPCSTVAKILISVLLVAAPATQCRADAAQGLQETPGQLKKLSLAQLGDIEVTTASKEPVTVTRTPAAIYVLTQEDIRRSGATSIPEVLRLVPGVEVARVNANLWAVGIRGFGNYFSKSVLVLIDGRSVYTPLFAGVEWNVQSVLLEDVERIEVIRGPGGTVWGSNAVSGVINIITKGAKDTRGAYASTSGGNMNQSRSAVR